MNLCPLPSLHLQFIKQTPPRNRSLTHTHTHTHAKRSSIKGHIVSGEDLLFWLFDLKHAHTKRSRTDTQTHTDTHTHRHAYWNRTAKRCCLFQKKRRQVEFGTKSSHLLFHDLHYTKMWYDNVLFLKKECIWVWWCRYFCLIAIDLVVYVKTFSWTYALFHFLIYSYSMHTHYMLLLIHWLLLEWCSSYHCTSLHRDGRGDWQHIFLVD